jgi:AmmeMemoRadiSam system protein B
MSIPTTSDIRPAAVAGHFYPAGPDELSARVDDLLSLAGTDPPGARPLALIAPHAGYLYSGPTAARAYALVRGMAFDAVVIVSPSHREYFEGASVYPGAAYATPVGALPVDDRLRSGLTGDDPLVRISREGHGPEHAVEVHLPFVLSTLGRVPFLPVVMGDQDRETCLHLGSRLGEVLRGRNALLVASTDLSHYHPYDDANRIDRKFVELVRRFDPMAIMDGLEDRSLEACGGGPTVAVMIAASLLGADATMIVDHCNSGDTAGNRSAVVGYLSAALYRSGHHGT